MEAGDVRAAYDEVQKRKDEAMAVGTAEPDVARDVHDAVERQAPQPTRAAHNLAMTNALAGMAWIARMCSEMGIEGEAQIAELFDVIGEVTRNAKTRSRGMALDREQLIELGVGAAFPTALWVGWLLRDLADE